MVEDSAEAPQIKLRSLSSEYRREHHGLYVDVLTDHIETQHSTRNIALTGAYGTGKSSILDKVQSNYPKRTLRIGLSSVTSAPEARAERSNDDPHVDDVTNRVQVEILKQLIYRDLPRRSPRSRFPRLSRYRPGLRDLTAYGLAAAAILVLLTWTGVSQEWPLLGRDSSWVSLGAAWLLTFALLLGVRALTYNRLLIERFSAGPASFTLGSNPATYFDRYLDEIVYSFETTGRDIVIFEDLDRFENVRIFEALRSLNTVLNGSAQVRRRRSPSMRAHVARTWRRLRGEDAQLPPVRFIYALRDSVFDKLGSKEGAPDDALDEMRRANRTKFFDLVVPVVPFVTHRNARDLLARQMEGSGVSRDLVSLSGQHVADMRLILNLRNEYDVFADRLLANGANERVPTLDEDRLFAILLYKNIHLTDFEKIRHGTSDLDRLHQTWRELVDQNIEAMHKRVNVSEHRLISVDGAERVARRLGSRLRRVALALTGSQPDAKPPRGLSISLPDKAHPADQFSSAALWRTLATDKPAVTIQPANQHPRNLSFAALETLLGEKLDPAVWDEEQEVVVRQELEEARTELHFLKRHTWMQLTARADLTWTDPADSDKPGDGSGKVAAQDDANVTAQPGRSFRDLTREMLGSDLARSLVAHGYLTEHYALYVSMNYGVHLRHEALNYTLHAIERGEPDLNYPLEPADITAILADVGTSFLAEPSAYNIDLVDYLLAEQPDLMAGVIEQVSAWKPADQEFTQKYLSRGKHASHFAALLAPHTSHLLDWLITEASLDDAQRVALVGEVIGADAPVGGSVAGEGVAGYIGARYPEFTQLTDDVPRAQTENAMKAIRNLKIRLESLDNLNEAALVAAATDGTYRVTYANLTKLINGPDIALDVIAATRPAVHTTVLGRVDDYLDAVREAPVEQWTVANPTMFVDSLAAVAEATDDNDLLFAVSQLAAPDCHVPDLAVAPERAWSALASQRRTDPTAVNVHAYLQSRGAVDGALEGLLGNASALKDGASLSPTESKVIAVAIINAGLESVRKADLVDSLNLETMLDPSKLTPQPGQLPALLIKRGLIGDDVDTFASALMSDWESLELAINISDEFSTFVSPEVLPARHLAPFFHSQHVTDELKQTVLKNLETYLDEALGTEGATAAAAFATRTGTTLSLAQLQLLVANHVPDADLLPLMASAVHLPIENIQGLLGQMGQPLAELATKGRQKPIVGDTASMRILLDRLRTAEIVSSYKVNPLKPSTLRVHKHY